MSTTEETNSSDNENLCVVCFKNVEIYSFGICDHAVCFECSTRMRVLCRQNECPICRQDLPKVIFSKTIESFSSLHPRFERSNLQDRKFGLVFTTSEVQKAYQRILEHRCPACPDGRPFRTFQQLKDHVRREHELFYCDICTENLKIFSFERRCYTRQELGHHRRKGDPDNTSHRGHPLCEFCDARYMDSDELFRHLRRNHLFCHFCDADGKHQYYNNMDDLKRHFRDEHYLCEEGECKAMPLTAVFRTDIDLKAHITQEHSRHMSKSATKQARTLELEFTLAPRPRPDVRNKRYNDRSRYEEEFLPPGLNMEPGGPGGGSDSRMFVNPLTPQDFPALGNATGTVTVQSRPSTTVNFTTKLNSNFSGADFPSLGGPSVRSAPAVTITTNSSSARSSRAPEVTITRTMRGQQGLAKTKDNFPALGGGSSGSSGSSTVRLSVNNSQDPKAPKVSIHVNHKPNVGITTHITTSASSSSQQRPTEAFPALGKSTNVAQPQWVPAKSRKQPAPKSSKVAAPPSLPPSSMEQFPSLAKKSSSVTVPVSNSWVNLNNINSLKSSSKTGSGDSIRKNEVKPTSSKQKQTQVENKFEDLRVSENESKNKNKKKKNKNSPEVETGKPSKANETSPSKNAESNKPPPAEDSVNNNESDLKNGLVKKRSELKIGTLTNTGESSNISNEFPILGDPNPPAPPPGFSVKPPPGFVPAPSAFPSLGVANDLTFTSSSGQSYAITPSKTYHQPSNFHSRNQNLIKRFMDVMKDNEAIKEFKKYSELFRNGDLPTTKYYAHCKEILGNSFEEVFPELLVLLPDISKQQELYNVCTGKSKKNLLVCENCKQVIFKRELSDHYSYHALDNHFPSLGNVQQVNNVWKK